MELVISIVIGILIVEGYAWLPTISQWLVNLTVRQLPAEHQERCREEWTANLNALPNTLVRLVHALSLNYRGTAIKSKQIYLKQGATTQRASLMIYSTPTVIS